MGYENMGNRERENSGFRGTSKGETSLRNKRGKAPRGWDLKTLTPIGLLIGAATLSTTSNHIQNRIGRSGKSSLSLSGSGRWVEVERDKSEAPVLLYKVRLNTK